MSGYSSIASKTVDVIFPYSSGMSINIATPKTYERNVLSLSSYGVNQDSFKAVVSFILLRLVGTNVVVTINAYVNNVFKTKTEYTALGEYQDLVLKGVKAGDTIKLIVSMTADEVVPLDTAADYELRQLIVLDSDSSCSC